MVEERVPSMHDLRDDKAREADVADITWGLEKPGHLVTVNQVAARSILKVPMGNVETGVLPSRVSATNR